MYGAPITADVYTAAPPAGATVNHAWKDGSSFSFHDVLDALNPLQHLPIIGTLYRWATGDEPGDVARMVGDGLYGGPLGLVSGAVAAAVKDETGKDPGEIAMAWVTGGDDSTAAVASAPAAAGSVSAASTATTSASPAATTAAATTAAAATSAASTAAPSTATHGSFMPLFKAPPAVQAASTTPEQAFQTQNAALQRSLYGDRAAMPARPITAPVPLQLSGPQLPPRPARTPLSPGPAAPATAPAAATPAATTAPATAPTPSPAAAATPAAAVPDLASLPQNPTVDIPQRMMEALDKYARMQQQQRGQAVDVIP